MIADSTHKGFVGITDSIGIQYGVSLLKLLDWRDTETHLIISQRGQHVLRMGTVHIVKEMQALVEIGHNPNDIAASVGSRSFASTSSSCVSAP